MMRQASPAGAAGAPGARTISASARASVLTSEESWSGRGAASQRPVRVARQRRAHVILPDAVGGQGDREARGLARVGAGGGIAEQRAQQRAQEQHAADGGGGRIAGQAEHAHRADPPMHQRLAGPHRDAPEAELHAGVDERLLHQVVIADRGAAERHQHVGLEPSRAAGSCRASASGASRAMPRSIGAPPLASTSPAR